MDLGESVGTDRKVSDPFDILACGNVSAKNRVQPIALFLVARVDVVVRTIRSHFFRTATLCMETQTDSAIEGSEF